MSDTVMIDVQELAWMKETIQNLLKEVAELKAKQKEHSHMIAA